VDSSIPASLAERCESEALYTFENGPGAEVRRKFGMRSLWLGGGVAPAVRDDPPISGVRPWALVSGGP
jgi:hypothetical protein